MEGAALMSPRLAVRKEKGLLCYGKRDAANWLRHSSEENRNTTNRNDYSLRECIGRMHSRLFACSLLGFLRGVNDIKWENHIFFKNTIDFSGKRIYYNYRYRILVTECR